MAYLYAVVFISVSVIHALLLFILRNQLFSIFSDDDTVVRPAANAMLAVTVFQIIDSINSDSISSELNGFLRGVGLQSVVAWIVLAVNFLGAAPSPYVSNWVF